MKRLKVLCIGSIFVLSGPLATQTTPDVASDNELFASYCLGQVQEATKEMPPVGDPAIDESIQGNFLAQTTRLQAYLRARGLASGLRSVMANAGVMGAIGRGRADQAECWAHIGQCVKKCRSPSAYETELKCTSSCRDENSACRSIARCVDEVDRRLPP